MSNIRVSNIEAKSDASSPTIDEKLKITNSQGRVLMQVDGKTSGITTIGINTTGNTFTVDGNNVSFVGNIVSANVNTTGVSTFTSLNVTGQSSLTNVNVGGVSTLTNLTVTTTATVGTSIGVNTTSPVSALDLSKTTNAIALPQGTTAQRPSGNNPYIRYNTTNSALEFYNGTDWVEIISDYFPTGSVILG